MKPGTLVKKEENLYLILFDNERQKYIVCLTSGRLNIEKIIPTIYLRVFPIINAREYFISGIIC